MSVLMQTFIPRLRTTKKVNTFKAQNRVVPQMAASEPPVVSAEDCIGQIKMTAQDMDQ